MTRQCMKCDPSSYLNNITQTCIQKCSGGSVYDYATDSCKCPQDKPYSDGTQCLECYLPKYWNDTARACLSCPPSQFYNTTSRKCQSCPTGYVFNPLTNICDNIICDGNSIFVASSNTCQACPFDTHVVSGNQCLRCPNGTHYDSVQKVCLRCPEGSTYNPSANQCFYSCPGDQT